MSQESEPLLRLVPPPDGQTYFGFTYRLWDTSDPLQGDSRAFTERIADSIQNELGGKRPTWLLVWEAWPHPFTEALRDAYRVQSVIDPHGLLYLDWSLTATTADNGGPTVKDIASGSEDAYIKEYARAIKRYRKAILIRLFGGEFNGNWWYGQSPWANPSLTTADFVSAWRRVVDIFRQEGALNASWAWIPSAPLSTTVDSNIGAYYPGDGYVDWIGADTGDIGPPQALDPDYTFAVAHAKPFFLAEFIVRHTGSSLTPPQQRDWLNAMFDYFESHSDIKAINYFDYNVRGPGDPYDPARVVYLDGGQVNYQANTNDNDGRLLADSGADFRGTYARRISLPRYRSAILTTAVQEQAATATIMRITVRGRTATVAWKGNAAATSYDVAVNRGNGRWQIAASSLVTTRLDLQGRPREHDQVRVRARDDIDRAGPWSSVRSVAFGR